MTSIAKISIGLISIAVVGGGIYYYTTQHTVSTPIESTATTNEQPSGKKMAFGDFIKQGGSYRCTVTQNLQGMSTQGIVYVADSKIHGEFTTNIQGQTISVTTIVKDGFAYTWTSMMPNTGFISKVVMEGQGTVGASTSGSYGWDATTIGDYTCEKQSVPSSQFDLPKGITFKDVQ